MHNSTQQQLFFLLNKGNKTAARLRWHHQRYYFLLFSLLNFVFLNFLSQKSFQTQLLRFYTYSVKVSALFSYCVCLIVIYSLLRHQLSAFCLLQSLFSELGLWIKKSSGGSAAHTAKGAEDEWEEQHSDPFISCQWTGTVRSLQRNTHTPLSVLCDTFPDNTGRVQTQKRFWVPWNKEYLCAIIFNAITLVVVS